MPGMPLARNAHEHKAASTLDSSNWRIVSRLLPRERRELASASARQGNLREVARVELLAPDKLERLAVSSLWLLVGSTAGYVGLNLLARLAHHTAPLPGPPSPWMKGAALLLANVAAYIAVVPLHEGVHALVILGLGGRPRFGFKLPIAAYCTAPNQLFTRSGYVAVALAPLIVISAAGAMLTWLAPNAGVWVLFLLAGNVSGAVGDLATVRGVCRLPLETLILDAEDGYLAVLPDAIGMDQQW